MGLLDGKVAIVTGAGHGIGRGHAMELAKQGAKVVVNDLGGSERGEGAGTAAEDTVKLIADRGGVAAANFADVSDYEQSGAMVQQAIDEFGRLDILVNNAGIVRDAAIWNMKVEDWDAVMKVHVRGTWCPSHHAAKHWREQAKQGRLQARIVNTTSGAGLGGNFGQTNYATAKAAIVGMTLTLAQELYKTGVTVNCIGPAGLTRITATMPGSDPAIEPDEVAEGEWNAMDPKNSSPVVAWLASDDAHYVTGQVIRVVHDRLILMEGWTEKVAISSGGTAWDAEQLPSVMATELFGTRHGGMRFRSSS
ncbi:MAG TPA: SDR family NAD(P)-dependent oxidoreductase [Acidimicrobiia bacterium]|nr:SDR family NAD(P)-dependent oxidoreductase [Acidimicrobiia bacterium]